MPRYFFHITDGRSYPDDQGTELPSLVEARREAVATFVDVFKNRPEWSSDEWRIEIADVEGTILVTLTVRIQEISPEAAYFA